MSGIQVLSKAQHQSKGWKPQQGYLFAAQDSVAALGAVELTKAALSLPIALVKQEGQFVPVALLGVQSGKNQLVSPEGRWLTGYIPALYRCYPFRLAKLSEAQLALCVYEQSIVDNAPGVAPFFGEDTELSKATAQKRDLAVRLARETQKSIQLFAQLDSYQLIQPWPLTLASKENRFRLEGIYRIDEAALGKLPAEVLQKLMQSGALAIAYCQLLSMQNIQSLVSMVRPSDLPVTSKA